MKYLKLQYSTVEDSYHILSQEEREIRRAIWLEQLKAYESVMSKQRKFFSKKIIHYIVDGSLHDYHFKSFHFFSKIKRNRDVFFAEATLQDPYSGKTILLRYEDVKAIKTDLDFKNIIGNVYLFGEMLYENKLYTHNFVIIFDSEINISCKKITVIE